MTCKPVCLCSVVVFVKVNGDCLVIKSHTGLE